MKKIFYSSIISILIFLGCTPTSPSNPATTTVEYQFTASDPTLLFNIFYNDNNPGGGGGNFLTGWRTSFSPSNLPFTASLFVLNQQFNTRPATVTQKILVNGVVVQEATTTMSLSTNISSKQIQYTIN